MINPRFDYLEETDDNRLALEEAHKEILEVVGKKIGGQTLYCVQHRPIVPRGNHWAINLARTRDLDRIFYFAADILCRNTGIEVDDDRWRPHISFCRSKGRNTSHPPSPPPYFRSGFQVCRLFGVVQSPNVIQRISLVEVAA